MYVLFGVWSVFFRLVSGAGDIKLTKDGNVLLHEMVCVCDSRFVYQEVWVDNDIQV